MFLNFQRYGTKFPITWFHKNVYLIILNAGKMLSTLKFTFPLQSILLVGNLSSLACFSEWNFWRHIEKFKVNGILVNLFKNRNFCSTAQQAFTCSKLLIETQEQVECVSIYNKYTIAITSFVARSRVFIAALSMFHTFL